MVLGFLQSERVYLQLAQDFRHLLSDSQRWQLPVPLDSHERVKAAIGDSRRSLRDIADLMQDSPALVLSVMREANSHTHGSLAEPAENLEVALNRLGLKRAEELLHGELAVALGRSTQTCKRGLRELDCGCVRRSEYRTGFMCWRRRSRIEENPKNYYNQI